MRVSVAMCWVGLLMSAACAPSDPSSTIDAPNDARTTAGSASRVTPARPEVSASPTPPTVRDVTMCLTGAVYRADEGNQAFNALCALDRAGIPGILQSCDNTGCFGTFSSFLVSVPDVLYPALFGALDENADGVVDRLDAPFRLNLLAFSWGAVAAAQIAGELERDERVAPELKRVERMVLFDAFQLGLSYLEIPPVVRHFRSFRHSLEAQGDCSSEALFGPYLGLEPRCRAPSECLDYDYARSPSDLFILEGGASILGAWVGHCSVAAAARLATLALFADQPYANVPAQVPVSPY